MPKKVTRKKIIKRKTKQLGPLWKGPEEDGVTQSLLGRFLVCKERFRIMVIEGLRPNEGFSPPLHYGQMWHMCEEALAVGNHPDDFKDVLIAYCGQLCQQFPTEQITIDKWYNVCLQQFPVYAKFWAKHPDVKHREPILQEETFNVPYTLPSGRVVKLRGKWDSVDVIGRGRNRGIYLQENKSKGQIDEVGLARQLTFDLQTMMYLIALQTCLDMGKFPKDLPDKIAGIRYNVIRRPLSGGKGSIKQHKPTKTNPEGESKSEFYDRLATYFTDEPKYWFFRWKVAITETDIQAFKDQFFDPCLEHLCLWYDFVATGVTVNEGGTGQHLHYRFPYGVWNPITEGKGSDVEEYLTTGSKVGLHRVENLFSELGDSI